jgi:lipoprotein-releasing system permease protein
MNLSLFIAKRYLISKKSRNAINIVSGISISVVAVATAALIIIFSVFNGFDDLIRKMLNSYDPDLKIVPVSGKVFSINESRFERIKKLKSIAFFAETLEDNVLLKSEQRQKIAVLKGVSAQYNKINSIDSLVIQGEFSLSRGQTPQAVFGAGIAYFLGINIENYSRVEVWIPDREQTDINDPLNAFNTVYVLPSAILSVDQEFDEKYVITDINTLREISRRNKDEVSAVEIKIAEGFDIHGVQKEMKQILGKDFEIKDRIQQHAFLYKIMKSEKWAVFFILLFVIFIASFSITGALIMLILEKKKDIATLKNMGAPNSLVSRIFLLEGWLISFVGAFIGIFMGFVIVMLQIRYSLVRFPESGTFIIEAYPVKLAVGDFFLTFFSVVSVGFVIALIPIRIVRRFL